MPTVSCKYLRKTRVLVRLKRLSICVGLLEATFKGQGARIMMFVGGPGTSGPGAIVNRERTEDIRSNTDLQKGNAPLAAKAIEHYTALADRCVNSAHVVDIFACALDQSGVMEMKVCVSKTGGVIVLADSFGRSVFKESFRRMFSRYSDDAAENDANHLTMAFAASLEVLTSREFKVSGAIGCCAAQKKTNVPAKNISETEIGVGGTNTWSLGALDPHTSIAVYFDVSNQGAIPPGKGRFIQFVTRYQHSVFVSRQSVGLGPTTLKTWNR